MPKPKTDVTLYVLLDPEHSGGHDLPELARAVVAGGATLLQFRDKRGDTRSAVTLAREVIAAVADSDVPVLINDRVDIAQASGARGVHLGQTDMAPADARAILGPDAIIGETIKSEADCDAADPQLLNYVGLGGVFVTTSKKNPNTPLGLDGLSSRIERLSARGFHHPVGAIAGINSDNAGSVIKAGADGICVISAVTGSDPDAEACALRAIVDAARSG